MGYDSKPCVNHPKKEGRLVFGRYYCQECLNKIYENAPVCPTCGIKQGFAPGTGDCGCGDEY
jgi:hypothetical protein